MNYKLVQFLILVNGSNFIDYAHWNRLYVSVPNEEDKQAFLHWAKDVEISYGREMLAFSYKDKKGNPVNDSVNRLSTDLIKKVREDENVLDDIRKSAQRILDERAKIKVDFKLNQINCKVSSEKLSGWLSPNGEFFSTPWGEHESFAGDYVFKHKLGKEKQEYEINGGGKEYKDFLIQVKRFVLLDNPSCDRKINVSYKTLSKAQKRFLEDFFIRIGDNEALKEIS